MKNLIETLRKKQTGYGHFRISIEMDGQEFKTTTTNTMAIDAAFDDCYDDEDNSGRYYESREEAQVALVNEILRANEIEDIDCFTWSSPIESEEEMKKACEA